jgi:hypothetical protein
MRLIGPLNSGTAAGSAGSATANATSSTIISGEISAVYVRYNDSPPAGTTDVTIAGANVPAAAILTLTDAATDGWFFPRAIAHDAAGAAVTFDGTNEIYVKIPVHDTIKVTIAGANAGDSADVWLMVD